MAVRRAEAPRACSGGWWGGDGQEMCVKAAQFKGGAGLRYRMKRPRFADVVKEAG